jgi:hypothetical protein
MIKKAILGKTFSLLLVFMFTSTISFGATGAIHIRSVNRETVSTLPTNTADISYCNWSAWKENCTIPAFPFSDRDVFGKLKKWNKYACVKEDSIELIIGIEDGLGYSKLTKLVKLKGGHLIHKILIKNEVVAIVVEVPLREVSF